MTQPLRLIEFPADDLERARRFWQELLGVALEERRPGEGSGAQTHSGSTELGGGRTLFAGRWFVVVASP